MANTYTLSEAVNAVQSRMRETDSQILPIHNIKQFINDCHMQVLGETHYPFLNQMINFNSYKDTKLIGDITTSDGRFIVDSAVGYPDSASILINDDIIEYTSIESEISVQEIDVVLNQTDVARRKIIQDSEGNFHYVSVLANEVLHYLSEDDGETWSKEVIDSEGFNPVGSYLVSGDFVRDKIYIHNGLTSVITSSFSTPNYSISGLAYDGTNLISGDDGIYKIYIHDGITSTVTSSFASPGSYISDLTYDGTNLISCDYGTDKIYIHSGITSTVTSSFASPSSSISGLTYDGTNLISCDFITDKIYIHSGVSTTILSSFGSPSSYPYGLTYDGANLISCNFYTDKIYIHDGITSTITSSFATPGLNPKGIVYIPGESGITLNNPTIEIDVEDNLHIVYSANAEDYAGAKYVKYNKNTEEWGTPEVVTNTTDYKVQNPTLLYANNTLHLAFQGITDAMSFEQIFYTRKTDVWGGLQQVTTDIYNQTKPILNLNKFGNLQLMWQGRHGAYPVYERLRFADNVTGSFSNFQTPIDFEITTSDVSTVYYNGKLHITFLVSLGGYNQVAYMYQENGIFSEYEVLTVTNYQKLNPVISIDANENVYIFYSSYTVSTPSIYQIHYIKGRFDNWENIQQLTSETVNQQYLTLLAYKEVGSSFIWRGSSQFYASTDSSISSNVISGVNGIGHNHKTGSYVRVIYHLKDDLGINNLGKPIYLEVDGREIEYYDGRADFKNDMYTIYNGYLILPYNSDVNPVTFKYKANIQKLEDSDTFLIPDEYISLVVEFALYKAKMDLEYPDFGLNFQEYTRIRRRMRADYAKQTGNFHRRIKSIYQ